VVPVSSLAPSRLSYELERLPRELHQNLVPENILDDTMPAGRHEAVWNARDDSGNSVSSGIYFYRVQAGKIAKGGKMTLVR